MLFIFYPFCGVKADEAFCKALGLQVKKLRLEKGMGKREFAAHVDMEYSQLAKIERGATCPTVSTLLTLSKALDITLRDIFDFEYPL